MDAINYIINQYQANHNQNIAMEMSINTFKKALSTQENLARHIIEMMNASTPSEAHLGQNIDIRI